jgi:hypothetical protein
MPRNRLLFAALLGLLVLPFGSVALAGGQVNLLYGEKSLDNDLSPVEDQDALGLTFSFGGADWPVMLAVDLITSDESLRYSYDYYYYDVSAQLKIDTMELDVGVRKFWGANKLQGYVGGGVAYLDGEISVSASVSPLPALGGGGIALESFTLKDSDSSFGYFLNAGGLYRLGRSAQVGIDLRYSDGSDYSFTIRDPVDPGFNLFTVSADSKSTTIAVFFGFRWGD